MIPRLGHLTAPQLRWVELSFGIPGTLRLRDAVANGTLARPVHRIVAASCATASVHFLNGLSLGGAGSLWPVTVQSRVLPIMS